MFGVWECLFTWKFFFIFIVVNVIILLYNLNIIVNCLKSPATGKSKYVLVTGCDSGFGYKTARELNVSKVKVFAACLTEESVKQFENDPVFKGVAFVMDVTNKEHVEHAYKLIKEHVGEEGLWCVVNNAGILQPGPIEWQSLDDMQKAMNVNVWGTVGVTKAMIPLVKQARGRIVNITSMAGRVLLGHCTAYSMSKFAAEAFSDGLRYEMKPWGISVHIVEPGMFKTNILNQTNMAKQWEALWNRQPDHIKMHYGEEYLNHALKMMEDLVNTIASTDIKKVTDAICHAVLSSNPKKRYPVGYDAWSIWMVVATFPTFVGDLIMDMLARPATPTAMKDQAKEPPSILR